MLYDEPNSRIYFPHGYKYNRTIIAHFMYKKRFFSMNFTKYKYCHIESGTRRLMSAPKVSLSS